VVPAVRAGSVALRALADRSGLTAAVSAAASRRGFVPVHDRGRVLTDTAVMIADGGRVMSDLAVLRDQGELFGPVASDPTLWRTLEGIDALRREKLAVARARVRRHVWDRIVARQGAIPASPVADRDLGKTIVIRLDATLVIAQSVKEQAAATFKRSWATIPSPLPSTYFALNQAWCIAAGMAVDLLAWLRLLCLTGDLAKAEPKTLRYRLLHTAARIIRDNANARSASPKPCPGPPNYTTHSSPR
jgi:Transposase DDE domain group 1